MTLPTVDSVYYTVKLELVDALEDPYVAYERGIVSVDWNNWPQVEYPDI